MKSMINIMMRDFKGLFFTPMFYFIASLCAFLLSYSYVRNLIDFAYSSGVPSAGIKYSLHQIVVVSHISITNIILIFAVPAITMKLISEEKKSRTYDLLLTSPVTSTQIVAGKFFGGLCASLFIVFISFLYPLGSLLFADIDLGLLLSSYIGISLVCAAYVAIGLFCSSLSSSIIASVIMGVVFNLALWFLSQGTVYSESDLLVSIMDHMSIGDHLFSFVKGALKFSSIVYFISACCLFVFLSGRVIESSRWR